jgi:hypothetical protein
MVIDGPLAALIVECSDAGGEPVVGARKNDIGPCVRWRRWRIRCGDDCRVRRDRLGHRPLPTSHAAAFDTFTNPAVLGAGAVDVPLIVVSGESGSSLLTSTRAAFVDTAAP